MRTNKDNIFKVMQNYSEFSLKKINQVPNDNFVINNDIRWYANYCYDFTDENIPQAYLNNLVARTTRWDLWNDLIKIYKKYEIKTNLDIGCANNHFSFLLNKQNIFSIGIDPRIDCLKSSYDVFRENFCEKFGYVGTISTFVDFFLQNQNCVHFDCVSILNFLHGKDHKHDEIKKLFEILPKITNKIIISEPNYGELNLPKLTKNFTKICSVKKKNAATHTLYDIKTIKISFFKKFLKI